MKSKFKLILRKPTHYFAFDCTPAIVGSIEDVGYVMGAMQTNKNTHFVHSIENEIKKEPNKHGKRHQIMVEN